MEPIEALQKLADWLTDENCIIASECPSAAAEKSQRYDRRLQLYRTAIFSLLTENEVVKHLETSSTFEEITKSGKWEEEAKAAVAQFEQQQADETNEAAEAQAMFSDTINMLQAMPAEWREAETAREELLKESREMIEEYSNSTKFSHKSGEQQASSNVDDWPKVSAEYKKQREEAQRLIADLDAATAAIHAEQITPNVKLIEEEIRDLKMAQSEAKFLQEEISRLESVLSDVHGIRPYFDDVEMTPDGQVDYNKYLAEEISVMSDVYAAEAAAAKDIFEISFNMLEDGNAEVSVIPRRDWVRDLRRVENVPVLKQILAVYSAASPFPVDVKLKVDLSNVPGARLEEVKQQLAASIDAWKTRALNSVQLDLHGLVRIFVTK